MKHTLRAPGSKRLKLGYEKLLSNVGFDFNLRRYNAAVISSMVNDGTEVISSGLGEVEHRKRELRGIDDKFMKLLKSLELTQDASYNLRASLDNTS